MKKELLENSSVMPQSPETITEVTVGGDVEDLLSSALPESNKKSQDPPPEKEKRKGMLTGEAYSRAVDRFVQHVPLREENNNDDVAVVRRIRLRKEVNESKSLLEAERKLRLKLEEQIHALEAQLQLQIEVPDVDNSEEITAHILGRKPQKMLKVYHSSLMISRYK